MAEKENFIQLLDNLVRDRDQFARNFFKESVWVIQSLKKKCDDKTNECNGLRSSLDTSRNKIISLYSELDDTLGKYNKLLENTRHSKAIIDSDERRTQTQSQIGESLEDTNKDKTAESIQPYIENESDLDTQSTEDLHSQSNQQSVVHAGDAKSTANEDRTAVVIFENSQINHDYVSTLCCDICGRFFARKGNLRQHQNIVHRQRNFKCTVCEKTFTWKYQLLKHKKAPCNRKRYKCTSCNTTFAYISSKRRHEKVYHVEFSRYWCTFCKMAFDAKTSLNEHLKRDHSRTTLWQYDERSTQSQCTVQST